MKKLILFLFVVVFYSQLPSYQSAVEYLIDGVGMTEEEAIHSWAVMLKDSWENGVVYYDFRDKEKVKINIDN
jgi:hypothetical protein